MEGPFLAVDAGLIEPVEPAYRRRGQAASEGRRPSLEHAVACRHQPPERLLLLEGAKLLEFPNEPNRYTSRLVALVLKLATVDVALPLAAAHEEDGRRHDLFHHPVVVEDFPPCAVYEALNDWRPFPLTGLGEPRHLVLNGVRVASNGVKMALKWR